MNKLINNIREQAVKYLTDSREFAPFGSVISKDDELKMVMTWNEDLDSLKMYNFIKESFIEDFKKKKIKSACLCIDVKVDKTPAIMIEYTFNGEDFYSGYFKYIINDEGVFIDEKPLKAKS